MTITVATDGDVILSYLEKVLCRQLRADEIAVMDNLSAHKVDGVRALVEAAEAELRYLPPYSPDFNPIEKCWSQVKHLPRAAKARSMETLEQARRRCLGCLACQAYTSLLPTLRTCAIESVKMGQYTGIG